MYYEIVFTDLRSQIDNDKTCADPTIARRSPLMRIDENAKSLLFRLFVSRHTEIQLLQLDGTGVADIDTG